MNTKLRTKATLAFLILMISATACNALRSASDPTDIGETENWDMEVEKTGDFASDVEVELLVVPPVVEGLPSYDSIAGIDDADGSKPATVEERNVAYDEAEVAPPAAADESSILVEQQYNLRAGSVDDNEQWDDYLLYRIRFAETYIQVRDIDVTERHVIRVTNGQGLPILGAKITIRNEQDQWITELMTYSDGRAHFFPLAQDPNGQSYQVDVKKNGQTVTFTMDRDAREHEVILEARSASSPVRLDVHFLLDATGSMSDEISQLTNNMIAISERIHELPGNPDVRFSMTTYRDRRDEFVSRTFDFTPDIELFIQELRDVIADGGGDYPESLNEGLHDAIHLPEWRTEETISLIFLIADAPPHLDYPNDYDYAEEVFEAAQRGIKIFPLASSGLDDQGEYIFRQLAQITSGKFLFLTYGADGRPGNDTTHHVDDYSVLSLDQLVIRLVEEELANLRSQDIYQQ